MKIMVVGCGGTGSEIIKLLKGHELVLVDFDNVEVSNLSRQFYFTESDCGKSKAGTIASKTGHRSIIRSVEELSSGELNGLDVVFSCLDSVSARMELNLLYIRSNCQMLIDCGTEGTKLHVKRVGRDEACLYCIKYLYNTDEDPYFCSIRSLPKVISAENRKRTILAIVASELETHSREDTVKRAVNKFNSLAPSNLHTDEFEMYGYVFKIIPTICVINSICASYAILMMNNLIKEDFIFYNGQNGTELKRVLLEKDYKCIICSSIHNYSE